MTNESFAVFCFYRCILCSIFFGIIGSVYALDTLRHKGFEHPFLSYANSLENNGQTDSAFISYMDAAKQFSLDGNYKGEIFALCRSAGIQIGFNELSIGMELLNKAKSALAFIPDDNEAMGELFYRLGVLYEYQLDLDSALIYHDLSLNIRKDFFGSESFPVAISYNAIANIYRFKLLNYYRAESFYSKAFSILIKLKSDTHNVMLADICYNLGSTYLERNDGQKALTYARQAKNFYLKNNKLDFVNFSFCEVLLANIYIKQKKYAQAISHFNKSISYISENKFYADHYLPNFYTGLGEAWINAGNLDSSLHYLNISEMLLINSNRDKAQLMDTFMILGLAYQEIDNNISNKYYSKSLNLCRELFNKNNSKQAKITLMIVRSLIHSGNYQNAIDELNLVLCLLDYDFFIETKLANRNWDADVESILETVNLIAYCQSKLYIESDSIDYLELALSNYLIFDKILEGYRPTLLRENSRIELSKNYKSVYEDALECVFKLYETKPTKKLQNIAFRIMEKNKNLGLFEFLEKKEAYESLGVPDSIWLYEKDIETKLYYYSSELNSHSDEILIREINSKIYHLEQELDSLKDYVFINYPDYYSSTYSSVISSFEDIQTYLINNRSILVEFFYGKSAIYMIAYSSDSTTFLFHKINDLEIVEGLIFSFHKHLDTPIRFNSIKQDYECFVNDSFQLFLFLFFPLFDSEIISVGNENIIIVPDGLLAFIPFEALLEEIPADRKKVDYSVLKYLIKSYSISYNFSSQVLIENNNSNTTPRKALIFDYAIAERDANDLSKQTLKGTANESDYIETLFPSIRFSGHTATKENFFAFGEDVGIIHLGLHGYSAPKSQNKRAIRFWGEDYQTEKTFLFYHELIGMKLKARLTVLSACETALGDFIDGEGVFNIARGFRYAGCPSLVAALWNINDISSSLVIKEFYNQIAKFENLDAALRLGKLKYIYNGDELSSHPHYWSGILLIGDKDKISIPNNYSFLYYILIFSFGFGCFILFRVVRKF